MLEPLMERPLVRRLRSFDWGAAAIIAVDVALAVALAAALAAAYLESRGM